MTRKKGGFFTFICSLLPGAGEMYMGFFKQGISIMSLFFIMIVFSSWLELGPLMFVLPVLWFYSFFHVHNLSGLSDEEFYAIEDSFIFESENHKITQFLGGDKSRKILAVSLIVVGVFALWNIFSEYVEVLFETLGIQLGWIYDFMDNVPQIIFAIAIILLGIHLIRGKKKELNQLQDMNQ